MADSTEYHVWDEMTKNFADKLPYEDNSLFAFLSAGLTATNYPFKDIKLKLLDVGCNLGLFDQIWVNAGFDTYGIDQITRAIDLAKQKVPEAHFEVMKAENMQFNQEFDVVFTNTVLQHMKLDLKLQVLAKIYHALKVDGLFLMSECTFTKNNWNSVPGRSVYTHEVTDGYSYTQKSWIDLLSNLFRFEFITKHPIHDWYLFKKRNNCYKK
jgi:2-polyprenyl-3-methyl-5-hydroxy-6-metoxy-1,4-benzoquinol methylase